MKRIALLDFATGTIFIRDVPEDMQDADSEEVAASFENELKVHLDDCQYMVGELTIDQEPKV